MGDFSLSQIEFDPIGKIWYIEEVGSGNDKVTIRKTRIVENVGEIGRNKYSAFTREF